MSDLVGNLEDRISHNEAHILLEIQYRETNAEVIDTGRIEAEVTGMKTSLKGLCVVTIIRLNLRLRFVLGSLMRIHYPKLRNMTVV